MKEHFKQWEDRAEDSYLRKHAVQYHNGGIFDIDVKIILPIWKANVKNNIGSGTPISISPSSIAASEEDLN